MSRPPDRYTEEELARVELRMEILDEGEAFRARLLNPDPRVWQPAMSELKDAGWRLQDLFYALDALADARHE